MGFDELSPSALRSKVRIEKDLMTSMESGKSFQFGRLEIPRLADLRRQLESFGATEATSNLIFENVVSDVQTLHLDSRNQGAVFQVASQFNLLEMTSPCIAPEYGVDRYESDPTQGPACAIAAGAGTIYRNYFHRFAGQMGQCSGVQIDCLADMGTALDNRNERLWSMSNGYALVTAEGLQEISKIIDAMSAEQSDHLRSQLRIGVMWNTEVTLENAGHLVTQAYCSALPVSYSSSPAGDWQAFASIVLEAAYEATFLCAIVNHKKNNNPNLFLTLLGGGAFGNDLAWIFAALERSLELFRWYPLKVFLVARGSIDPRAKQLAKSTASLLTQVSASCHLSA